jgi:hypothetical protein
MYTYTLDLFFFKSKSSPKAAPPNMRMAPITCIKDMLSLKKIIEKITADSGSIYPHIATV